MILHVISVLNESKILNFDNRGYIVNDIIMIRRFRFQSYSSRRTHRLGFPTLFFSISLIRRGSQPEI